MMPYPRLFMMIQTREARHGHNLGNRSDPCMHVHEQRALHVGQDVDAVQAYILLRRWVSEHPEAAVAQHLGPEHEAGLVEAYFLERTYAIKSLELVLQHSKGVGTFIVTVLLPACAASRMVLWRGSRPGVVTGHMGAGTVMRGDVSTGDQASAVTQACQKALERLMSEQLEEKLFAGLCERLQPGAQAASAADGGAGERQPLAPCLGGGNHALTMSGYSLPLVPACGTLRPVHSCALAQPPERWWSGARTAPVQARRRRRRPGQRSRSSGGNRRRWSWRRSRTRCCCCGPAARGSAGGAA